LKRQLLLTVTQEEYSKIPLLMSQGWLIDPQLAGDRPIKLDHALVWPLVLYETSEEVPKPVLPEEKPGEFDDVTDVKSLDHAQVAEYIAKGYRVHEIFQKNVIVTLRGKPVTGETPTTPQQQVIA